MEIGIFKHWGPLGVERHVLTNSIYIYIYMCIYIYIYMFNIKSAPCPACCIASASGTFVLAPNFVRAGPSIWYSDWCKGSWCGSACPLLLLDGLDKPGALDERRRGEIPICCCGWVCSRMASVARPWAKDSWSVKSRNPMIWWVAPFQATYLTWKASVRNWLAQLSTIRVWKACATASCGSLSLAALHKSSWARSTSAGGRKSVKWVPTSVEPGWFRRSMVAKLVEWDVIRRSSPSSSEHVWSTATVTVWQLNLGSFETSKYLRQSKFHDEPMAQAFPTISSQSIWPQPKFDQTYSDLHQFPVFVDVCVCVFALRLNLSFSLLYMPESISKNQSQRHRWGEATMLQQQARTPRRWAINRPQLPTQRKQWEGLWTSLRLGTLTEITVLYRLKPYQIITN